MPLESDEALGSEPIRQGDIFAWENRLSVRPWKVYGLVVTADCDLVNNKTWGQLSYVPVLLFEDYIWMFWRPRVFDQFQREIRGRCAKRIGNALKKKDPDHAGISEEAVDAWLKRAGVEGLVNEIAGLDAGHAADLRKALEIFETSNEVMASASPRMDLLGKLFAAKMKLNGGIPDAFAAEIRKHVASLPGDVFFLSGIGEFEKHGVFAMLRHISQCDVGNIAVKVDDVIYGAAVARRIARLKSPYCYALTQNLAKVFSDIGLPRAYDEAKRNSPSEFTAAMFGDLE